MKTICSGIATGLAFGTPAWLIIDNPYVAIVSLAVAVFLLGFATSPMADRNK